MKNILTKPKEKKAEYFDDLISLFDCKNREWQIEFAPKQFSDPFFANSGEDIANKLEKLDLENVSISFTVQKFSNNYIGPFYDWDFIIDIDRCELDRRKEYCLEIMKLLDSFGLIYLIDPRYHIWFPNWEHSLINNWTSFYNSTFAVNMKNFLEIAAHIKGKCDIDSGLWYWKRHKIRCPYTFKDAKLQILLDNNFIPLSLNRIQEILKGTCFTAEEQIRHCLDFEAFLKFANEKGEVLTKAFSPEVHIQNIHIETKCEKIRPCFEYMINNIFTDKKMDHMNHSMRLALVQEALCSGITNKTEIASLFRNQKDFSLEKTLYQVGKLLEKPNFKRKYRCSTIQKLRWCIEKECNLYEENKT